MNTIIVTKREALTYFDGRATDLAKWLGLTDGAVSQWGLDAPIPELHALKIHFILRPTRDFKTA